MLDDFDKIWILNLHGNSNIGEVAPDGTVDKNVFDIRQGVAIYIFARTPNFEEGKSKTIKYGDLWGARANKYEWLFENSVGSLAQDLKPGGDRYYLIPRKTDGEEKYYGYVSLKRLMPVAGIGTKFRKDNLLVRPHFTVSSVSEMISDVRSMDTVKLEQKYNFKETKDWLHEEQRALFKPANEGEIVAVSYRPFDFRYTYYPVDRIAKIIPRGDSRMTIMQHLTTRRNFGLCLNRQIEGPRNFSDVLVCDAIFDLHGLSMKESNQVSPLYLVGDTAGQLNFDPMLYGKICKAAGIDSVDQAKLGDDFRTATGDARPSEVKVFDYIYGVLHSPAYREKYREFLKIDFPRVPFPQGPESFTRISQQGEALRRLHLMEDAAIGATPYPFAGEGDGVIAAGHPKWEAEEQDSPSAGSGRTGKVWVNPGQYFTGVSNLAWNFHIGGYQPAQKWLKDRRGRTLGYDDIRHYQKIVRILEETHRIMQEIELPLD